MTVDSCMFVPFIIIIKQGVPTSSQVLGRTRWPRECAWWSLFAFPKLVQNIPNSNNPTTFQDLDGASVCQPIYTDRKVFFKSFTASFLPLELFEHLAEIFKKPNGTQICFTAKAYNGRVLSQWLADCLRDAISKHYHDDHEQLPLLASCMFLGLKVSSTSTCIFK